MKLSVLNIKGKDTGRSVELPNSVFNVEPNTHTLYLYVKQYLAAQRQGTSQTKTRSDVQGSTRKLHRQKGTGGSRKGNIRNPLYKGGGRIFGPQARTYSFKLNKKVKTLARAIALSVKAKEKAICILEDPKFEVPKTAHFLDILKSLKVQNKKVLFLVGSVDENIFLSLRNLKKIKSALLQDFNAYDVLNSDVLIITEQASKAFEVEEEPKKEEVIAKPSPKKEAVTKELKTENKTVATEQP